MVLSCDQLDVLSARLKKLDEHCIIIQLAFPDITYKGVNKWTALQQWGIQEDQMVCFGNSLNDLPMFQKAYYSVLIGKCEPLRAFARKNIAFDGQIEQKMIATLRELCLRFAEVK
ncbi:HAD hydrolase family protein [Brevibacillus laterosporus]|nr:HAD hydrolase family protein [Brevibacillus laterosporus]